MARKVVSSTRRSPCPIACSLDVFGDRWTLLVVRDLILGKTRYKDFVASPEAIPTNILADRLQKLLRHDIVRQVPVSEKARHFGYKLTAKGEALKPLLRNMRDWGLKWQHGMAPQPRWLKSEAERQPRRRP